MSSEWISVKDGLPKNTDNVWVRFEDGREQVTWYMGAVRGWWARMDGVTHWQPIQPMPAPPNEEGKSE